MYFSVPGVLPSLWKDLAELKHLLDIYQSKMAGKYLVRWDQNILLVYGSAQIAFFKISKNIFFFFVILSFSLITKYIFSILSGITESNSQQFPKNCYHCFKWSNSWFCLLSKNHLHNKISSLWVPSDTHFFIHK